MQRFQTLAVIAGTVLFAGVISAQGAPTFDSLDANKDGQISIQEATGHDDLFVAFKKLDTNKDGMLSKEEFAAYAKK
jgi:Ca2+-binding EF-hand superfamily protein